MADYIGLGVAGNFTEHLEQAGEASDFKDVLVQDHKAPKGIFPWYVPSSSGFLANDPTSSSVLIIPKNTPVQAEPELFLSCKVKYKNNSVTELLPISFGAFNDASQRIDAPKISKKKNWGDKSQGLSSSTILISKFSGDGNLDKFVLGSWLKRDDEWYKYGETSEVRYYSYFYQELLEWLVDKMNTQHEHGPLENISEMLKGADYPELAQIAVGSTRYTIFGEKTLLRDGDVIAVVLFDESRPESEIVDGLKNENLQQNDSCVFLLQTVEEK